MKIAIYMDINDKDYENLHIQNELISKIKHILTDIDYKASLILNPIISKDIISKEFIIK